MMHQPNSDLPQLVEHWSDDPEFKSHWGQFLTKFILFCVTFDLSNNLTEMRQIGLSSKIQLDGDYTKDAVRNRNDWSRKILHNVTSNPGARAINFV